MKVSFLSLMKKEPVEVLLNLGAYTYLSKTSKIDPVGILANKHWISAVLDPCPAADPNWGALKKASQAVFDVVRKDIMGTPKQSGLSEVNWDAASFADQLSVLLYHFRRVCNIPARYFAAIEECKSHGMQVDDFQGLCQRFEPLHLSNFKMDGFGQFKLNDAELELVHQVKEKNKQK